MPQMLSTIASYKEQVNAAEAAHKMIGYKEFDTPDIKWYKPDTDFQNKIKHRYIISTVMDISGDDTLGIFVGAVAMFAALIIWIMIEENTILQNMKTLFVCSAIIVVCVSLLAICLYNIYIVKPKIVQKLLSGDYLIADLDFVCAVKEDHVESSPGYMTSHTHRYFTTNVLFNIGLHSFQDGGLPYLYMVGDDLYDCETKLKYTQYKLLSFEYENGRHKKENHYAICGLIEE